MLRNHNSRASDTTVLYRPVTAIASESAAYVPVRGRRVTVHLMSATMSVPLPWFRWIISSCYCTTELKNPRTTTPATTMTTTELLRRSAARTTFCIHLETAFLRGDTTTVCSLPLPLPQSPVWDFRSRARIRQSTIYVRRRLAITFFVFHLQCSPLIM